MHTPLRPWTPQARRAARDAAGLTSSARAIEIACSRNAAVRVALAGSRAARIGVLILLSTDPHPAVRAAVAANPVLASSASTIRRLAHDPSLEVRDALQQNVAVRESAPTATASPALAAA